MTKYNLSDLGYKYRGVASKSSKSAKLGDWVISDIPEDYDTQKAIDFVKRFINGICAIEVPTSLVCNLRCKYCYIEDPRMKNKYVEPDIVEKILLELPKLFPLFNPTNQKKEVYYSAWGAEPLANVHTLEVMQKVGRKLYGKDGGYKFHTSTNATLWSSKIEEVLVKFIEDKAFKNIQVSLDGPKWLQDEQRPDINRKGTYDRVEQFCKHLTEIGKKYEFKQRPYGFCSTIHLVDDNFAEKWVAAAEFFSTPNTWHTNLPGLPMRMSGEDLDDEVHIKRFIEAQRLTHELLKQKASQGITVFDFYTGKLFGQASNIRTRNAFSYCSALNTQLGVDVDGNLYPCHGPITTPLFKPFLYLGNLFDKTISFSSLYRNFSYQYGTLWTKGKCVSCPIHEYATGSVCWSCPAHNLAISNEPSIDSALKCIAYEESFKYWIANAKMMLDNPVLDSIPKGWYNDIEVPNTPNKKVPFDISKIHFDPKYNNLITRGLDKWHGHCPDHENVELTESWWIFDNFQEVLNE